MVLTQHDLAMQLAAGRVHQGGVGTAQFVPMPDLTLPGTCYATSLRCGQMS